MVEKKEVRTLEEKLHKVERQAELIKLTLRLIDQGTKLLESQERELGSEEWLVNIIFTDGETRCVRVLSKGEELTLASVWAIGERLKDEAACVRKIEIIRRG